MRIVSGLANARELLRRRRLEEPELPPSVREVTRRVFGTELDAATVVDRILRDVRKEGDAAVRRYNESVDGVKRVSYEGSLEVSRSEIEEAYSEVAPRLIDALRLAAERVRAFHERQLAHSTRSFEDDGLGQMVMPLRRVGIYVPGTSVVYPSTVLMTAVPARVAGVEELVMATPVAADGSVAALKLVAADLSGVDRIFRAGGVQGIGAMAFGTETVPKVDKICGPGNIFVTLAKKKLFGEVGIDGIFGPSETLVIADQGANVAMVAADLLAGAEHDELATAVLITDSAVLAEAVSRAVNEQLRWMERCAVAEASLAARGGLAIVSTLGEAIDLANEFAPEHLCLHLAEAAGALASVRNAGCVFVGSHSAESIGDYTAGPSHVMPTGGSAAYSSPLGVHDFLKVTSVVRLDQSVVELVGPAAAAVARAEGLTGHTRAIESRLREIRS